MSRKKIVIGITGASGAIYAENLVNRLHQYHDQIAELGIVLSENAVKVRQHELGLPAHSFAAGRIYDNKDFFAPFASGSSRYDVMIICPCTMGTLGRIAHGYADDLISRTADVMLKENKKLILLLREMPFNLVHIENMKLLCQSGAIICPASPSFYFRPKNIEELINTVTDKMLLLAGFEIKSNEWGTDEA
ncbi:MAG TPA: UbiX family flavin prenyltransferase [Bacteroidales bacterium]|nr:UbiX family flavin prenyltransferase [Bacteroidales bacterium]HPS26598.1 UbiX family flavin prenyltransferase [Bacteroidales bacterium]